MSSGSDRKDMAGNCGVRLPRASMLGSGVAIGTGLGVALGLAFDNLALGIAIGTAIGTSLGAAGAMGAADRTDAGGRRRLWALVGLGLALLLGLTAFALAQR